MVRFEGEKHLPVPVVLNDVPFTKAPEPPVQALFTCHSYTVPGFNPCSVNEDAEVMEDVQSEVPDLLCLTS